MILKEILERLEFLVKKKNLEFSKKSIDFWKKQQWFLLIAAGSQISFDFTGEQFLAFSFFSGRLLFPRACSLFTGTKERVNLIFECEEEKLKRARITIWKTLRARQTVARGGKKHSKGHGFCFYLLLCLPL